MPGVFAPDGAAFAAALATKQADCTNAWHAEDGSLAEKDGDADTDSLDGLVQSQHWRNCSLWHEEDKARVRNVPDAVIAEVKRRIDALNQQRNDLIERIDDEILRMLTRGGEAPAVDTRWNSETPGSMIDKLSILSLKVFHTGVQAARADAGEAHREKARTRLATLRAQREDLATALGWLLVDLEAGRLQMKLYRQFKMYNDPDWNPALYRECKR